MGCADGLFLCFCIFKKRKWVREKSKIIVWGKARILHKTKDIVYFHWN